MYLDTFVLVFRQNEYYGADMVPDGGAAYIVLNPRNLNGHATIPAPPVADSDNFMQDLDKSMRSRSKWSINSANSVDESEGWRGGKRSSIDLEWENDGNILYQKKHGSFYSTTDAYAINFLQRSLSRSQTKTRMRPTRMRLPVSRSTMRTRARSQRCNAKDLGPLVTTPFQAWIGTLR